MLSAMIGAGRSDVPPRNAGRVLLRARRRVLEGHLLGRGGGKARAPRGGSATRRQGCWPLRRCQRRGRSGGAWSGGNRRDGLLARAGDLAAAPPPPGQAFVGEVS